MRTTFIVSILFVFLWSSAYIALKLCAGYSEPASFVLLRASIVAVLLVAIIRYLKLSWPERLVDIAHSSVVGILIHGIYSGGVFAAFYHGLDAGVCALILGIQPVITTAISIVWLDETSTWLKSTGISTGFAGVVILIVFGKGGFMSNKPMETSVDFASFDSPGVMLCLLALIAISVGMLYQKRYCSGTELLPGVCIQYAAAAVFLVPIAISMESMSLDWSWSFIAGLIWLVLVVSIGAMSLLMFLIRRGEAGAVATLFFLVPPLVAIEAWVFFDEKLNIVAMIAMLLCTAGVALVGYTSRLHPDTKGSNSGTKAATNPC